MKKILLLLLVAMTVFIACNSNDKEEGATPTETPVQDTTLIK